MNKKENNIDLESVAILKLSIVELVFVPSSKEKKTKDKIISDKLSDFSLAVDTYLILEQMLDRNEEKSIIGFVDDLYKAMNENESLQASYDIFYQENLDEEVSKKITKLEKKQALEKVHQELKMEVPKRIVAFLVCTVIKNAVVSHF